MNGILHKGFFFSLSNHHSRPMEIVYYLSFINEYPFFLSDEGREEQRKGGRKRGREEGKKYLSHHSMEKIA